MLYLSFFLPSLYRALQLCDNGGEGPLLHDKPGGLSGNPRLATLVRDGVRVFLQEVQRRPGQIMASTFRNLPSLGFA